MIRSLDPEFPPIRCPLVWTCNDQRQRALDKALRAVIAGEVVCVQEPHDGLLAAIIDELSYPDDPFHFTTLRVALQIRHVTEAVLRRLDRPGEQSDYLPAIGFRLTWNRATGELVRVRPGLVKWRSRGETLRLACPLWGCGVEGEDYLYCGFSLAAGAFPGYVRQALGHVTPEIVEMCLDAGVRDTILGRRRREGYAGELADLARAIEPGPPSEADDSEPPF